MIFDSSKNYLNNTVLIHWDGDTPTDQEIDDYCRQNYGCSPNGYVVSQPDEGFGGYTNPGHVYVNLN